MALTFWDRALERMTEGEGLASICTGADGLPSLRDWWRRCDEEPEFLARAHAAAIAGELIPAAEDLPPPAPAYRSPYTAEQYEAALEDIRAGRPYYLKKFEPGVISHASLDRYRKRNPEYDQRMRQALAERGYWVTRKVGAKVKGPPKPRSPAGPSYNLRRALLQNEMYAAIEAAIPKGLPAFIRDDVRSEMLADMLAGDLELADAREAAGYYLSDYYRQHDVWRDLSLDAPIGGDTKRTFVDMIDDQRDHF